MRVGILGGTFDPPHIGHQILAAEAMDQLELDQVLWLLTPNPPHKTQNYISATEHRVHMVELAITNNPGFMLSKVDIERDPPHYAVDTMDILRSQAPGNEYYYLMGLDSLNDLPNWHDPSRFISLCHKVVVMARHGEELDISGVENKFPGLSTKLLILATPMIQISGTEIRQRAELGRQYRYFLPDRVYRYIRANRLYQV